MITEQLQLNFTVAQVDESGEEWREIPGYEGAYQASTWGRLQGVDRKSSNGRKITGRILKTPPDREGYLRADPMYNGKAVNKFVHYLIALTFHGPPPTPQHEVNHIDGNRANNRPDNLEWVTHAENIRHSRQVLGYDNRGEKHGRATMTEATAREIKARYRPGVYGLVAQLSREYGLSYSTVHALVTGQRWKHL